MANQHDSRLINRFPTGIITPPSSKSLCHRAVLCAALASGSTESEIRSLSRSADIDATLLAATALGATWRQENGVLYIKGGLHPAGDGPLRLHCGESGSTLRFLIPVAATTGRAVIFTGEGRLLARPMDIYRDIFTRMGCGFRQTEQEIFLQGALPGGVYNLPGHISSQFISGLLFALPLAEADSTINLTTPLESAQYVDLTLDMLALFGIIINPTPTGYHIPGGQQYRPAAYTVEGDYSQAAFFLAAGALGQPVSVQGLNPHSRQGDRAILQVLADMGANITQSGDLLTVTADTLRPVTVDARAIPDLIPPIAALCCFCHGTSHITNAGRLRIKESDRLHALAVELAKLGAQVTEGDDSLTITGADSLPGGTVDSWNDHRIAMAMAVAAIRCRGPVTLTGWQSVNKSYPDFWRDFEEATL